MRDIHFLAQLTQTPLLTKHRPRINRTPVSVDLKILQALRSGPTRFHGFFYQDQMGELRKLVGEPEASKFLKVEYGNVSQVLDKGTASEVTIELNPVLLKP